MENYKISEENQWQYYSVSSNDKLAKVIVGLLIYPERYIPICDNGELTGVVDKKKLKKISPDKIKVLTINNVKEDCPNTAFHSTNQSQLIKEMKKRKINYVFLFDRDYQFKGVFQTNIASVKKPIKNVFDRLFELSLFDSNLA